MKAPRFEIEPLREIETDEGFTYEYRITNTSKSIAYDVSFHTVDTTSSDIEMITTNNPPVTDQAVQTQTISVFTEKIRAGNEKLITSIKKFEIHYRDSSYVKYKQLGVQINPGTGLETPQFQLLEPEIRS